MKAAKAELRNAVNSYYSSKSKRWIYSAAYGLIFSTLAVGICYALQYATKATYNREVLDAKL